MKKVISEAVVRDLSVRLLKKAAVVLPPQFMGILEKAYMQERNPLARTHLKAMLEAARIAEIVDAKCGCN